MADTIIKMKDLAFSYPAEEGKEVEVVGVTRPPSSASCYLQFQLQHRGTRELRFDRVEWAREVVVEVSEAHFRFVQRVMEVKRDRPVDLALRTHPLALCYAPSLLTTGEAVKAELVDESEDS